MTSAFVYSYYTLAFDNYKHAMMDFDQCSFFLLSNGNDIDGALLINSNI